MIIDRPAPRSQLTAVRPALGTLETDTQLRDTGTHSGRVRLPVGIAAQGTGATRPARRRNVDRGALPLSSPRGPAVSR